MKKTLRIIMMSAAGLLMGNCSSTEAEVKIGPDTGTISVADPFIYKGTRASGDITSASIIDHEFKVWGYTDAGSPVFAGQTFSWSGSAWTYSPSQKWSGNTISFGAIAPTEDGCISQDDVLYDSASKCFTIYKIPAVQEISNAENGLNGVDYLVAEALENRTEQDGDLQFSFHHILTKLRLFARYQTTKQLSEVKITNLELSLPTGSSTYSQINSVPSTQDQWSPSTFDTQFVPMLDSGENIVLATEFLQLEKEFFIAPIKQVDLKMNLSYTCYATDGSVDKTETLTDIEVQGITAYNQGQIINLYITIMHGELGNINFRPEVSAWYNEEIED